MSPYEYMNAAGQRFALPERLLEPSDCWQKEVEEQIPEELLKIKRRT